MGERVLLLRTCDSDMTSWGGFVWPESGPVEAPDWDGGLPMCGGKLHGFLWGQGNGKLADWEDDAKWLVISADIDDVVEIHENGGGKHGFRRGVVEFCGNQQDATSYLMAHSPIPYAIIGASVIRGNHDTAIAGDYGTATTGHGGTATTGDRGTATAGDRGIATTGHGGTATTGDYGTATAGHGGTATTGDYGTATAGHGGTATAGNYGTATTGDRGIATAGHGGTATAGNYGTATASDRGIATAGYSGTATAGHGGTAMAGDHGISIVEAKGIVSAGRGGLIKIGEYFGIIREGGLLPHTKYRLNESNEFVSIDLGDGISPMKARQRG